MKELKKEFEELKEKGVLVVEVRQNGKVVNYWLDKDNNLLHFISALYNKAILKTNAKLKYKYNYDDLQTITEVIKRDNYDNTTTTFEYIYYNIPTKCGYLDFTIDKVF